ncbi:MAG: hypothetical protein BWY77_01259 [bacterium ADurb.Bin431]|nr:MAG: hypothetical protein BWY77_01259 [bacterium ADurb.Bin431]
MMMLAPMTKVNSSERKTTMIWSAMPTPAKASALSRPMKIASTVHIRVWEERSNTAGREVLRKVAMGFVFFKRAQSGFD